MAEVRLGIAPGRVSVSLLGKDEGAVPDCVDELRVELDAACQVLDVSALRESLNAAGNSSLS